MCWYFVCCFDKKKLLYYVCTCERFFFVTSAFLHKITKAVSIADISGSLWLFLSSTCLYTIIMNFTREINAWFTKKNAELKKRRRNLPRLWEKKLLLCKLEGKRCFFFNIKNDCHVSRYQNSFTYFSKTFLLLLQFFFLSVVDNLMTYVCRLSYRTWLLTIILSVHTLIV